MLNRIGKVIEEKSQKTCHTHKRKNPRGQGFKTIKCLK
jgi:hypothetical protein